MPFDQSVLWFFISARNKLPEEKKWCTLFLKKKKSSSSEVETLARKQWRYQRMKRNAYRGSPSQRTQQAQTGESQRGSGQGTPTAQRSPGRTGILGKARSCTKSEEHNEMALQLFAWSSSPSWGTVQSTNSAVTVWKSSKALNPARRSSASHKLQARSDCA